MFEKIIICAIVLFLFLSLSCAHIEPNNKVYRYQVTDLDNGKIYFVNSYSYMSDGRIVFYSKGNTYATHYKIVELK